jgi:hypothetical protein
VRNPLLTRDVYRPYFAASFSVGGSVDCRPQDHIGCVQVPVRPGETLMSIVILDNNGATVRALIRENLDDDPSFERTVGEICVRTREPISVTPGATVNILLQTGTCADGRTSAPTEGTISVVLEREG